EIKGSRAFLPSHLEMAGVPCANLMELAGSFRPTKKGCNLRIEMWDKKRNTKENVDIIFK
ncbi:hypothetical protein, partial [Blautia wexlerae]|uniref:hypothetical protein n=1 Tax=Blautia wexlerae TaxID=418240 RepID=UPI00321BBE1C